MRLKSLAGIGLLAGVLAISVLPNDLSATNLAPSSEPSHVPAVVENQTPAVAESGTDSEKKQQAEKNEPLLTLATSVTLALVATFLLFLFVFTRKLRDDTEADYKEITPMVQFCYFFTVLAFALAVAPPFVVRALSQQAYETFVRSPVGIVKGCVHTTTQSDWELACSKDDPFKVQWLFNIGGSARFRVPPVPATTVADAKVGEQIDDRLDSRKFQPVVVHGGLAVPWYFITLAIVGAAISLARKVPEYQRRAISREDAMNGPKLREVLEFQILQVLCAPFIAATIYNIATPSSSAVAATLGFSSGFASETILLAIRAGLDPVMKFLNDRIVSATGGKVRTDDEVTADVKAKLDADPELKGCKLEVEAIPGVVELKGNVSSAELSRKAEDLARGVAGTRTVKNILSVTG